MISSAWEKLKNAIKERPFTTITTLGISAIFLYKALSLEVLEISLSKFIQLVKHNQIKQCIVESDWVTFNYQHTSGWSKVNVAMLSKELLHNLILTKQNIDVVSRSPQDVSAIMAGVASNSIHKLRYFIIILPV